jgi:hypothetical protein
LQAIESDEHKLGECIISASEHVIIAPATDGGEGMADRVRS